ncbi:hypothetical protein BME18_23805 [Klebsiella michiganensis]|nr:hypothetical protein [Klebsiella michiganensis]MDR6617643.1 energy-coupling factor transporter transmembrane protein EcfT [Klebsiella sp. 1400]NMD77527.1 hypothetical protein [Klebsiella sp. DNRA6]QPF29730.1 hypothetical protein IYV58_10820 [Klebsiella sp. BDA134-6]QUE96949.1 hypothetical protein KCG39_02245 [Klebsiella pasteurii]
MFEADMYLNPFCYLLLVIAAVGSLFTPHSCAIWLLLVNILTLLVYGAQKLPATDIPGALQS